MSDLPRLAWNNLAPSAQIIASGWTPGHEPEFICDGTLYRSWQPGLGTKPFLEFHWFTPQRISTWCLYGHNLGAVGAGIGMGYNDNGIMRTHPIGGHLKPRGSECLYLTGPTVLTDTVRFVFSVPAAAPRIAALFVGEDMVCERGVRPGFIDPSLGATQVVQHSTSRTGLPLPSVVEDEYLDGRLSLTDVSLDWARNQWLPFKKTAQTQAFWLRWHENAPPAYCSGAQFEPEVFTRIDHVSCGFSCRMAVQ